MPKKKVVVFPGDDAAPEAMAATRERSCAATENRHRIRRVPAGEEWKRGETDIKAREANRQPDSKLFVQRRAKRPPSLSAMGQEPYQTFGDPATGGYLSPLQNP